MPAPQSLSPQVLPARTLIWHIFAVIIGVLLLSASSYISIPMVPVPITLQTLVVTLVGALLGWRLGATTVVVWLVLGAFGLPVLAGGTSGMSRFSGATAGYLFAFPIAAALCGALVAKGWNGLRPGLAFLNMVLSTAVCLVLGGAWLAANIGLERAIVNGVTPFLMGGLIKSAVGALILFLIAKATRPEPN